MKYAPFHCAALALAMLLVGGAHAQNTRENRAQAGNPAQGLNSVAQERRKLEDARGDASRRLRELDQKVGRSSRGVGGNRSLAAARDRSAGAIATATCAKCSKGWRPSASSWRLCCAPAYTLGENAPLKLLLAQDRVADANRALAYHRYVQRERTQQIQAITAQLRELDTLEQEIAQRRGQLDSTLKQQQSQVSALEQDRKSRAQVVSELDEQYRDRSQREKALGQDARALEKFAGQPARCRRTGRSCAPRRRPA